MELVRVGKIINTFGIKGEVKVHIITDFPDQRFQSGNRLYLNDSQGIRSLVIENVRYHKDNALILFEDINDINQVLNLKGLDLFVDKDQIQELDNGHYSNDLIGLNVYEGDEMIGEVIDVEFYPAHSILKVKTKDKLIRIPYVDAFIKDVDIKQKKVLVELIEGLR
ncbi:MAG: ribosome maturation factor RimM [Erysipelotrichaceae bacterium]|nr:ribosome maturation factor RimM [Erysipelotrichaceae bacterium]MDD4643118.1 ribosome maturation factor RimM [Erysipelotrichaceae bacterium]